MRDPLTAADPLQKQPDPVAIAQQNAGAVDSWLPVFEAGAKRNEDENEAVGTTLRDTGKWMFSGVALAAGGVITGASLSNLGSLEFERRFYIACGAGLLGLVALARLSWVAIQVMVERPTLRGAVNGRGVSRRQLRRIDGSMSEPVAASLALIRDVLGISADTGLAEYVKSVEEASGRLGLLGNQALSASYRSIESRFVLEFRLLQFRRLRFWTFAVALVAVPLFGAFAWAANPGSNLYTPLPPQVVNVPLGAEDREKLQELLQKAKCPVSDKLKLIRLGEWKSGAQDAVTNPVDGCLPIRLRLDRDRVLAPS